MAVYISDTIRIRRLDKYSLVVERLEDVTKKDGSVTREWIRQGYHGTIQSAATAILRDMANRSVGADEAVQNATELLEAIRDAERSINRAIRSMKESL